MFYEIELTRTITKDEQPTNKNVSEIKTILLFSPCEINENIMVFVLLPEIEKIGGNHIYSITELTDDELNEYHNYYKSLPLIKI